MFATPQSPAELTGDSSLNNEDNDDYARRATCICVSYDGFSHFDRIRFEGSYRRHIIALTALSYNYMWADLTSLRMGSDAYHDAGYNIIW